MKRPLECEDRNGDAPAAGDGIKMKKVKQEGGEGGQEVEEEGTGFVNLDDNLLFEVLKHVDARTLGRAACVSKHWQRTVQDERLWELICTRHWANIGCGNQQLRSVVLALGGFRRLHSQYLWPLSKPQSAASSSSSSSSSSSFSFLSSKDKVHLSLSLLSIRYYEKMKFQ